jgi:hypothetical protein
MRRIFWLTLAAPFFPSSAFGWGCAGHQMVAMIARAHLTPAISAAVDALLQSGPVDAAVNRFCQDRPADLMVDSATWADDVRISEKNASWHFVDIPLSVNRSSGSVDEWCPDIVPPAPGGNWAGCITKALDYNVAIVKDTSRSALDRANALRYVIHFAGDLHQPLHDENNNDQGGNCTVMQVFTNPRPGNLHSLWDSGLIQHALDAKTTTQAAYAADLNSRFGPKYEAMSTAKVDDPIAWAWSGYSLAASVAYGDLQPSIPVEKPDAQATCQAERDKVTALHISIDDAYYQKAMPVVDEQLATAGYRLAYLLNSLF